MKEAGRGKVGVGELIPLPPGKTAFKKSSIVKVNVKKMGYNIWVGTYGNNILIN